MSNHEFVQFSEKTVKDAIAKACAEFKTTEEKLEVEIVERESKGFLGILGGKPAVIKARVKEAEEKAAEVVKEAAFEVKKVVAETASEVEVKAAEVKEAAQKAEETVVAKAEEKAEAIKENLKEDLKLEEEKLEEKQEKKLAVPDPEAEAKAAEFVKQVCAKMGIDVEVITKMNMEENTLEVTLDGEDMGVLIGKRGQTLDSLQYLVSLVVNKDKDDYLRVRLDTENYRERRKETLENLARNIAFKVKKTRHSVSLEPMNPYERRIIHSALQGEKYITTRSEGDEPYRHVVVSYKREQREDRSEVREGRENKDRRDRGRYNNRGGRSSYEKGSSYGRRSSKSSYSNKSNENVKPKENKDTFKVLYRSESEEN